MLELINRYMHGFVAVPVILACQKGGVFECLQQHGPLNAMQLTERLEANGGHLRVALRMLHSLAWLAKDKNGAYALTAKATSHAQIPAELLDLYNQPLEDDLWGQRPATPLQRWVEQSGQRWGLAADDILADFLDGVLVVPLLLALKKHNVLADEPQALLFATLAPPIQEALGQLFIAQKWA